MIFIGLLGLQKIVLKALTNLYWREFTQSIIFKTPTNLSLHRRQIVELSPMSDLNTWPCRHSSRPKYLNFIKMYSSIHPSILRVLSYNVKFLPAIYKFLTLAKSIPSFTQIIISLFDPKQQVTSTFSKWPPWHMLIKPPSQDLFLRILNSSIILLMLCQFLRVFELLPCMNCSQGTMVKVNF